MKKTLRLLAAAALGLPALAHAGPADYIVFPAVAYGEREIEFRYGTEKLKDSAGGDRTSEGGFEVGYGVTQSWFTELDVKYHKESGDRTRYDAFEWENKFQLTEPNKYFADVGVFAEIEIPRERRVEGYELAFGPLFQFDTGPLRWNVNPVLEKVIRSREEGPHPLELGYQLQAAYRFPSVRMDVGVQAFGDLGKWNDWEPHGEQLHRIGPAVIGRIKLEGRQMLKYNAAFLFGETSATPRHTFRMQVEYEF